MKYTIILLLFLIGCVAPPPNATVQEDLGPDVVEDEDRPDLGPTADMEQDRETPDADGRDGDLGERPPPGDPNLWPDGREPDIGMTDASSEEDTGEDENGRPFQE